MDNWLTYRRDNRLTANSNLKGKITTPSIKWKQFLGGSVRDFYAIQNPDNSRDLIYCAGGCIFRRKFSGEPVWISKPFGIEGISFVLDIDGDGITEIGASNAKEFFVFSGATGEKLYSFYFGPPRSSAACYPMIIPHKFNKELKNYHVLIALWSSREVLVFDFQNGCAHGKLLHEVDVRDGFHPTVLAYDIDCDGEDEIIVTKRGAIYYVDYKTGKVKKSIDWISGGERRRNYGLFQIADINNDGIPECVVVSSLVSKHLSVISNDGKGNLSVLWDKFIEHIYPTDETDVRFTFNSLSDVDGDKKPEIVISMFNQRKDKKWWTEIIDPLNGNIKYEFEDSFLWGIQDIDGDGIPELFLSKEFDRTQKEYSDLTILDFNKKFEVLANYPESKFLGRFLNSSNQKAVFRMEFIPEEIWCESIHGNKFYLTGRKETDNYILSLHTYNMEIERSFEFPGMENILINYIGDLNNDGIKEIVFSDGSGYSKIMDEAGRIISQFECSTAMPLGLFANTRPSVNPVLIGDEKNNRQYLCFPSLNGDMNLFEYDKKNDKIDLIFKEKYVGKRGWNFNVHVPYAAKINGETCLALASGKSEHSRLCILSPDGRIIKEFDFESFTAPKFNNRLGIYEWSIIENNKNERFLIISMYSSTSMNSEETICLDYDSGKLLWQRKTVGEGEYGRGFGPYGWLSYEKNDDNIESFLLAKDTFCRFDLKTGNFTKDPIVLKDLTEVILKEKGVFDVSDLNLGTRTDGFSAYGSILLEDINKDGKNELVFFGCFNAIGVLDHNNKVLWWKDATLSDLCMRYQGFCDIDNDGYYELGVGHANGEFTCYSALDGHEKWKINLNTVISDVVTCDIDGDGFYEYIFGTADGRLIALGDKGIIKWQMDLQTSVGNPIIGDFDCDGSPEIFVSTGDGYLLWIK